MAHRRADVLEVVVLAADAHALLRRGRARVVARLAAEEHILELVHAGVREEQRRVVVRHERRAGHGAVAIGGEVGKKRPADLVRMHRSHGTSGWGWGLGRVAREARETTGHLPSAQLRCGLSDVRPRVAIPRPRRNGRAADPQISPHGDAAPPHAPVGLGDFAEAGAAATRAELWRARQASLSSALLAPPGANA